MNRSLTIHMKYFSWPDGHRVLSATICVQYVHVRAWNSYGHTMFLLRPNMEYPCNRKPDRGELKIYCFCEHLCIDFCFAFNLSISESDVSSIWLFLFSMPMLPKNQQFPTVLHFRTNEDIIISLSRKKKLCFVGD